MGDTSTELVVMDVHLCDADTHDEIALIDKHGERKWWQIMGIFTGCDKPAAGRLWVTDGTYTHVVRLTSWKRTRVRIRRRISQQQ